MTHRQGRLAAGRFAVVGLAMGVLLSGCAGPVSDEHVITEPAVLEEVDAGALGMLVPDDIETDVDARIRLEPKAAERLGIATTAAIEAGDGRLAVPLAAVLLTFDGRWWVYRVEGPLLYLRWPVDVVAEEGQTSYLAPGSLGPGTEVVTVGVPELWGFETGIGH